MHLFVPALIFLSITLVSPASAKGDTERAGDILTLLIPAIAYGTTLYTHDTKGEHEFYWSYGSTVALTHILKETVRAPRPHRPDSHTSFPSGHSSSAFAGAAFIHKKYGLSYALPAYLGAIYTAYSRVHAQKHYTRDVVAGALIGIGFSWYFATPYDKLHISPDITKDSYGVQVNYKW
jgi:membrane-associated phospholipid phosphatase